MKFIVLISVFMILSAFVKADEKKETLVLLDNLATRETHSIFFKNLQGKLFEPFTKGKQKANSSKMKIDFLHRSRIQAYI